MKIVANVHKILLLIIIDAIVSLHYQNPNEGSREKHVKSQI